MLCVINLSMWRNADVTDGRHTVTQLPQQLPNGLGCVYVISVPDTSRVTLTFTKFDVENSTDCKYDYVEVLNCCCCCNYGRCYF